MKTPIGTTPLTEMTIDTGASKPVSQKPYPTAMKHCQWVKDEMEKLFFSKSHMRNLSLKGMEENS